MSLEGKVAIVTGGGRGLGAAYCRALAAEGVNVVAADITEEGAGEVAGEIDGLAVQVDVADEASVKAMTARALERYGRIDILVNNAAIFVDLLRTRKPFDEIPVEEWDRVMAVNVRGVWLCCKAVAPAFRRQRSGIIVNISSGTIHIGAPGFMHYVTSKAAVWGMTRVLARELGEFGVRVNAITPGFTASEAVLEITPTERLDQNAQTRIFKRIATADDLIGTMLYLCSDASAFVTGQTVNVDGGAYMH
jgi:3-oxoacyl-[acyl-carrier protein] reductase